jgi:D-glucosaminate-6-phosphate ammonia-lyase
VGVYEELGVSPVINGAAWLTVLGGSRMAPGVVEAMVLASRSYVDIHALQHAAGQRIASMTRNEAAYVTSCCSAGVMLATWACMTAGDSRAVASLPAGEGMRREIVMFCGHRIPYDRAVTTAGAEIVQVGNVMRTHDWELDAAIGSRTAAVLYVAGEHLTGALDLATTVSIAHARGVPVIVDAAAQLPPVSNFWHFTRELGADLALFSGGKVLGGPQASGLMVGSERWVTAASAIGSPHDGPGRALKVGKEEIAGLVRAVEMFVELDHTALLETYEGTVACWIAGLAGIDGVSAVREFPGLAGRPIPRLRIDMDSERLEMSPADVVAALRAGAPPIAVLADSRRLYVTPETLTPQEADVVLSRLRECLTA